MVMTMEIFSMIFFVFTIGISKQTDIDEFKVPLVEISSTEELSKLLEGSKTALLGFISNKDEASNFVRTFLAAAEQLKQDMGAIHLVDCSNEGKEICGDLDVSPEPYVIQYYADGEFKRIYDGEASVEKILAFMNDLDAEQPWEPPQSLAINLEEKNFESFLRKKKHALVMFMAPWCIHCKNAKPQFIAAADELREDPTYAFAIVDCTRNSAFCEDVGIEGYPTINYYHYFDQSPGEEYLGEHDKSSIVEFMTKMEEEVKSKEKTEL